MMLRSFGSGRRHGTQADLQVGQGSGVRARPAVPDAKPGAPGARGLPGSEVLKIVIGLAAALGISLLIRGINNGLDHPLWHL